MTRAKSVSLSCGMGLVLAGLIQIPAGADDSPGGRRIVGGVPTQIAKHPWQVAFNIKAPNGATLLCGGSLVNQNWILTAAHCFPTSAASAVRVKYGVTNYVDEGSWQSVDKVIIHAGYASSSHKNDIALVKLKTPVAGKNADTIPLASAETKLDGARLEVTGWGATTEDGSLSKKLLLANVPYVKPDACNAPAAYNGTIVSTMLCAGEKEGGVDSCQGDSGGPLVLRETSGSILVGVVSFGHGCARKLKYGVYARVSEYREWISATMKAD